MGLRLSSARSDTPKNRALKSCMAHLVELIFDRCEKVLVITTGLELREQCACHTPILFEA